MNPLEKKIREALIEQLANNYYEESMSKRSPIITELYKRLSNSFQELAQMQIVDHGLRFSSFREVFRPYSNQHPHSWNCSSVPSS